MINGTEIPQGIPNPTGNENGNRQTEAIQVYIDHHRLAPIPNQEDVVVAYQNRLPTVNPNLRSMFAPITDRGDPFHIYQDKDKMFHGKWMNNSRDGITGISWEQTFAKIGKREDVYRILDMFAYAFKEAQDIYPWKDDSLGFTVESGMEGNAMTHTGIAGFPVSFENRAVFLAKAIQDNDLRRVNNNMMILTSDFVHERAHNEFDDIGFVAPEAISQGCQFLFNPGGNVIFEKRMLEYLDRFKDKLDGKPDTKLGVYEVGSLVWMTHLQEQLAQEFPVKLLSPSASAEENIAAYRKLTDVMKEIKDGLPEDQWHTLQQKLMKSLLEYDPNDQAAIINDFRKKASTCGFDFL